ncbi:glutamate receptor 4-like [Cherax quadricarinatus]|uniref:glutamate receptor 4-like n=1 Tax=Cherax quadricarinatus TaxID=27406 RepID=UPI00387E6F5A
MKEKGSSDGGICGAANTANTTTWLSAPDGIVLEVSGIVYDVALRHSSMYRQVHVSRWKKSMVQRRAFKPTGVDDRMRFVMMWVEGMSARDIALQTGSSVSTVYRWIRRWQRDGNVYGSRRRMYLRVAANLPLLSDIVMDLFHVYERDTRETALWSSLLMASVMSLLFFLIVSVTVAHLPRPNGLEETLRVAGASVASVAARTWQPRCSVILLTDGSTSPTTVFMELQGLGASWGLTVFEVEAGSNSPNLTEAKLSRVIAQARQVRQTSWCVTVMVVSDDSIFLAASAKWALKGRLLLWSTRFLAITRRPLSDLCHLYTSFSMMNAMLLILDASSTYIPKCSVYVHLPYSPLETQVVQVASWSPHHSLTLHTHLQLFPEKFSRLEYGPQLVVAAEEFPPHVIKDKINVFSGPLVNFLNLLAHYINFTYTFSRPPDGAWGVKRPDGSWSGMVGMVGRQEADLGLGPFGVSAVRAEMVDFMRSFLVDYLRIMGGRGRPEVDPWGFLLPLEPRVWTFLLVTLFVLLGTSLVLSLYFPRHDTNLASQVTTNFGLYVRALFQQDTRSGSKQWWERLVLGGWLVMVLVLSRSYSGMLTSFLAVRYIPQPFQTLRDLLDDSHTAMVFEADSYFMQYIQSVQSGIYHEVMESQKNGRLMFAMTTEYLQVGKTIAKKGGQALLIEDLTSKVVMTEYFSLTGRCDFYQSREYLLAAFLSMIGQKDNPLVPAMNNRIKLVTEAGLYDYWMKQLSINSTRCERPPTRITVKTTLSLANLWGMFTVLAGGLVLGLVVLGLEVFTSRLNQTHKSSTPVFLSS